MCKEGGGKAEGELEHPPRIRSPMTWKERENKYLLQGTAKGRMIKSNRDNQPILENGMSEEVDPGVADEGEEEEYSWGLFRARLDASQLLQLLFLILSTLSVLV